MSTKYYRKLIQDLLSQTNITINGSNPWDIQVHDDRFFARVIHQGLLGAGESYMENWWDCERLDQLTNQFLASRCETKISDYGSAFFQLFLAKLNFIENLIVNRQTKKRSTEVAKQHYDLNNGLFQIMLDDYMNYSCAYWKNATTLDEAQQAKLKLICEKLQLKPGMNVLDIGCGFGAFAKFAAENYKVNVLGITVSKEQYELGQQKCAGLSVELKLQDYRELQGYFDRVVSIGMFEHVGYKNYREFFRVVQRCLANDGLFLLHTIGSNTSSYQTNAWTNKYIFPNGMLPSIKQVGMAAENLFVMEDWHNFGADYDKTLMAWHHRFNLHWDKLKSQFDERFRRMWNYYLLSSAGSFRARYIQLWQIVFAKHGINGGYSSVR